MLQDDKVNVLLVDDQPAKLLAYETVLQELGENLIKASSAREALQTLLKTDVAILLIDVCMPELDGFQLAAMIREHPRFQQTAIIFVSAIHMSDVDRMRGYEMGAVDYVPVPVIPEVLRAKVKVFAELYRKTRQLEQLNADLERRVAERTAELEASNARLRESERRRSLALAAGQMGSWDWDLVTGECQWDAGQHRIFGVDPGQIKLTLESVRPPDPPGRSRAHREDRAEGRERGQHVPDRGPDRPSGRADALVHLRRGDDVDTLGNVTRASGVTIDITELKEAEARRTLAGARGRSPRAQRARHRAIDRPHDEVEVDRNLCLDGGGADRGAVDRACVAGGVALGRRQPQSPGRRRARALPQRRRRTHHALRGRRCS